MSTTFCPEQEAAINAEQNRIIAANCAKHGIQANQLTEGQIADARRTAEQNVEREQALASDPHYARAEQLQEENRQLKMQLAAMKDSRPSPAPNGAVQNANLTYERAIARVGRANWCAMSSDQRLASCGISPNEVGATTKDEIRAVFGSNSDSSRASDLMKVSPAKYARLKLIGLALGLI
jgi:hypothetical protein